jgi:flavin reductase (DIM6/NTAB) family NADH-FMN oxidoreductase RutF
VTTPDGLISVLRRLAMPVVVVSAQQGDEVSCATSTAMYVGLDPVLLVVSLRPESRTCRLALGSGEVSLSLLGADQADIADRAARRSSSPDKLADLDIPRQPPPDGHQAPGVEGAQAVVWGTVVDSRPVGDQVEILVQAADFRLGADGGSPLLRQQRQYFRLGEPAAPATAGGYPL